MPALRRARRCEPDNGTSRRSRIRLRCDNKGGVWRSATAYDAAGSRADARDRHVQNIVKKFGASPRQGITWYSGQSPTPRAPAVPVSQRVDRCCNACRYASGTAVIHQFDVTTGRRCAPFDQRHSTGDDQRSRTKRRRESDHLAKLYAG
jgi:hypothetical protein